MDERGLRELCRDLLRDLDLRPPLSAVTLCERLGRHRGRPIVLVPRDLPDGGAFGALVPMPTRDLVVYQRHATARHQESIIFHEVVHLVRGHVTGAGGGLLCGGLLPDVGPGDSTGTLYDRWQEWEAETGAAILAEWAADRSVAGAVPTATSGASAAERAIARAFGGGDWE